MHGKRPGNLKKCTGETQLKEGEEAAFVSFFKENLLWWWNHENLLPLLLIPTSCLNYNVCGDICHWPLLCVCVCTCTCSEAEAINSECRGFPDLPIILADAKQRAAARGCRGDTMWNWGWLLHVTGPEWSNASHMSSYANRGMTGERQWGWQTCIERQADRCGRVFHQSTAPPALWPSSVAPALRGRAGHAVVHPSESFYVTSKANASFCVHRQLYRWALHC